MTPCPLCGQDESRDFPLFYLLREKQFDAQECLNCGFVFVSPRPNSDEIAYMYSDEYFLHDGADFGAHSATDYETAARKGSVKFPVILGAIKKFKPSGRFFEIGCGMGYFLDYARKNGYEVSGIEYANLGTKICREKFGLDVVCSSFEDYKGPEGRFDVIFMGDVLEHLINPLQMLEKARTLLAPGGIVAAEVPSQFNCVSGRIGVAALKFLGGRKKMPMPPYHVNEFRPGSLARILKEAGYRKSAIIQRIKPPSTITLRGSVVEKAFKKSLQYPNYFLTEAFGVYGDRLLGIGLK
jgi:2-polyprenyl-3-methyl-5-hydroxy-6-metoxy-1,4-benzoquinol methylase